VILGLDTMIYELTHQQRQLSSDAIVSGETVYPSPFLTDQLAALRLTPPDQCRVLMLGSRPDPVSSSDRLTTQLAYQTPYYYRIFSEMLGSTVDGARMKSWAKQGVMLLNRELTTCYTTTEEITPQGLRTRMIPINVDWEWTEFTDWIIQLVDSVCENVVYLILGRENERTIVRNVGKLRNAIVLPSLRVDRSHNIFDLVNLKLAELEQEPIQF